MDTHNLDLKKEMYISVLGKKGVITDVMTGEHTSFLLRSPNHIARGLPEEIFLFENVSRAVNLINKDALLAEANTLINVLKEKIQALEEFKKELK